MIKNLVEIETALGLKAGEFKNLYEDKEEKEIPLTGLEIIPKADYDTRIANIKKVSKEEGQTIGAETTFKEIRNAFGFTGDEIKKSTPPAEFKSLVEKKVLADAKIEPDKKVKELQTDLATMTTNFTVEKQRADALQSDYKQKETARTINSAIIASLPEKMIIPKEKAARLSLEDAAEKGIKAELSDTGVVIFKQGDAILKDKNLVPLGAAEVLKDYFTPYVTPASGGGGGKDDPGGQGKPGTLQAFDKEMEEKNIKVSTPAYNAEMQSRIKAKTLVI